MSRKNQSIKNFFGPPQPSANPPAPTPQVTSVSPRSSRPQSSSSLSEPPSSVLSLIAKGSEEKEDAVLPSSRASIPLVVENSSDEDDDSEDDLLDLTTLLATKSSESRARQYGSHDVPSTPVGRRHQTRNSGFPASPLAVLPKIKFDLKSLVDIAGKDEAAAIRSKSIRAQVAARDEDHEMDSVSTQDSSKMSKYANGHLLDSVVTEREDGNAYKVKRALRRTEATVTEKRWCFFDTDSSMQDKLKRKPFPTRSVPKSWKAELVDPSTRYQTFVCGFAEDMISLGEVLPDELFEWMLNEICFEGGEPIQGSYIDTLRVCHEQIHRLMSPAIIRKLFHGFGATSVATDMAEVIRPIPKLAEPYTNREWAHFIPVVRFLGLVSRDLQQASRKYIICTLLRMSLDTVVMDNVDLLDVVQETLNRICRKISDEEAWRFFCTEVCQILFESVQEPTLRLQMVDSIPSTTTRTHDLRRTLAMCFFFKDVSYCKAHSYTLMDLERFMNRLGDPEFLITPETDYRELVSLVFLLNIAIDDGRSSQLDLSSEKAGEKKFNEDVDKLAARIKEIFKNVGHPGPAFISKIEAREALELVGQRVTDTVRTKPKPKQTWLSDGLKREEDLEREKKGMALFRSKMKRPVKGVDGQN